MKKFFTLTAFAAALATQIASANVTYGSVFPVDFAYGVPTGWALPSNNADAQTQTVDDGLQITCNQTAAKYRTDIKYNMFGDYNGNTDIWIDFDASKYKVFAIKFIGERPKSGCLKLSNISVSKSWIKGSEGYSLSEQGWKDLTDADGNHTYYWTVGGDNWTGTLSIDRIEIVIADITDDADKTFTVSSMNWYQSVEELEASLTLQQETAVVNETTKKGYADFTSAWKDAADGAVLLVNEDQEVSERLNSDSRSITVKGATKDTKITRKKAGNMLFLSNSKDCTLTLEDITLDGNGDESDRNFIEASSNGKVVYNNVLISNAKSTNGVGLVVAKNSGKVAMNGLSFENCTTNNDAVEVFIGSHGSTISGNNNVKISIEDNSNAYALTVDGELTNTTPIKLTPYNKEDNNFTEDYPLVKGTTDASKFVLNTDATQTLVADEENNLLVVHTSTSGVESLVEDDMNVAPVYYNVNGMRVEQPTAGLYIVRRGNTVTKEIVK
jgi:hypothetical protein